MSDNTGVQQPHLSQPPKDELRLGETATLEHRGGAYGIRLIGDDEWVIRSADGQTVGSLFYVSPVGEEHEPVYGVRLPGETETYHEGTDWRSIAATAINVTLDDDD
ncbi:hypothetical protein [Leifsonia sp. Root112D2]|uniref:hypothetical protein n=1 Tax=Leifsonia sp. Root112D2 TaxID=1736426 RepID=UPI000AF6A16A|nr:hypothetical protein [Leifsonia sp. Root112D2]